MRSAIFLIPLALVIAAFLMRGSDRMTGAQMYNRVAKYLVFMWITGALTGLAILVIALAPSPLDKYSSMVVVSRSAHPYQDAPGDYQIPSTYTGTGNSTPVYHR